VHPEVPQLNTRHTTNTAQRDLAISITTLEMSIVVLICVIFLQVAISHLGYDVLLPTAVLILFMIICFVIYLMAQLDEEGMKPHLK
jgi:hypothetical protein